MGCIHSSCLKNHNHANADDRPKTEITPLIASGSTSIALHPSGEKRSDRFPDPHSYPATSGGTPESSPARPTTYTFLDPPSTLTLPQPDCRIESLQSAFERVYDRYDTALKNRQKLDEKLREFKQVIGAHEKLHMSECFRSWRDQLTNPVFTISYEKYNIPFETVSKETLVKEVKVRSDNMPKHLWKAPGAIRDVVHACTLYIQQYAFLHQSVVDGMSEIGRLASSVENDLAGCELTRMEKQYLINEIPQLVVVYGQTATVMTHFLEDIVVLLREITKSVDCLNA